MSGYFMSKEAMAHSTVCYRASDLMTLRKKTVPEGTGSPTVILHCCNLGLCFWCDPSYWWCYGHFYTLLTRPIRRGAPPVVISSQRDFTLLKKKKGTSTHQWLYAVINTGKLDQHAAHDIHSPGGLISPTPRTWSSWHLHTDRCIIYTNCLSVKWKSQGWSVG